MAVARISIMRPQQGHFPEVEALLDSLDEFLSKQRGYILGFRFHGLEDKGSVGRIAVWASPEDANHAALLTHTEALRARLHLLIDPGHIEQLVEIAGSPKNLPSAPRGTTSS